MNIKEFLDLGFNITYKSDKGGNRRRVLPTESAYIDIFNFIKNNNKAHAWSEEITHYIDHYDDVLYKYHLDSSSYSGTELTSIGLYFDDLDTIRYIIEKETVKLEVITDKENNIYSIFDWFFNGRTWDSRATVYNKFNEDKETAISILTSILKNRVEEEQEYTKEYHEEINSASERYTNGEKIRVPSIMTLETLIGGLKDDSSTR